MSKNIIVCSDGTGQKGGYGADSNVYKLYEMIDIHNDQKQVVFYDNGIGTSEGDSESKGNKIFNAIAEGVGFGFKKNVLDLYRFIVRNYEIGDNIYFFGFSRGAATVRACVGFIHQCGLINRDGLTDEQISVWADKAMRAYEGRNGFEFKQKKIKNGEESLDDGAKDVVVKDNEYAPNGDLKVYFVGVWDTVSALGFSTDFSSFINPLIKLADRLSECFFPHEFYDYELNKNVAFAYQALAIDDARKTFHPKVWDESKGNVVEQVWFAGAHSNVGGGYPRAGMANVAFDWMLERAGAHGLVFITDDRDEVAAHVNAHDRLYDSRDGFGIYYRYKPRDLAGLCLKENSKESLLRGNIKIHESVIERMTLATQGYAPSYLPDVFDVSFTQIDEPVKTVVVNSTENPHLAWQDVYKTINNLVTKREFLYHAFMDISVTLLLIALALGWINPDFISQYVQSCAHCGKEVGFPFQLIYDILNYITPKLFDNFLALVVKIYPIIFIALLAIGFILLRLRNSILSKLQIALEKAREIVLTAYRIANS